MLLYITKSLLPIKTYKTLKMSDSLLKKDYLYFNMYR